MRVVLGDTDLGEGFGSAGSRSIFVGGSAVKVGAQRTVEHVRAMAASTLEAAVQDIDYLAGRFQVKGTDLSVGLFELAAKQPDGKIFFESTSAVSLARGTLGWRNCTLPAASTPCRAKTLLAVLMPTVRIAMNFPFRVS